jgi:hypothetical protein
MGAKAELQGSLRKARSSPEASIYLAIGGFRSFTKIAAGSTAPEKRPFLGRQLLTHSVPRSSPGLGR